MRVARFRGTVLRITVLAGCVALLSGASALAQVSRPPSSPWDQIAKVSDRLEPPTLVEDIGTAAEHLPPEVAAGWKAFAATHGSEWQGYVDRRSGRLQLVSGQGIPWIPGHGNSLSSADIAQFLNGRSEPDLSVLASIARLFYPTVAPLLGADLANLKLSLARSGQVLDAVWFIEFDVVSKSGPQIEGARVVFRVNNGNLVQFGVENLPAPGTPEPPFTLTRDEAFAFFATAVGGISAETDTLLDEGSQRLLPGAPAASAAAGDVELGKGYELIPVWEFVVHRKGTPGTWRARVDAQNGDLLEFVDINRYASAQVTGGVYPVTFADNNETVLPMPWADVSSGGYTNSAGIYNYTSGTVTSTLYGQYVRIVDSCGAISQASDGSGNIAFGTSSGTDCSTPGHGGAGNTHSARMQFYHVNRAKEKGRAYLPTNTWLQGLLRVNVNLNQTCNAYWNGSTLNFFRSGGGCGNTGELAAVSLHEYAHGLDDNDGSAASDAGTGETYGDWTATLQTHTSCVGKGFQGSNCSGYGWTCTDCTGVRDIDYVKHDPPTPATPANFNATVCPSSTCRGPCNRECHCESAPSSQANWDMVTRDLIAAPLSLSLAEAWTVADRLWYVSRPSATNAFTCNRDGNDGCAVGTLFQVYLIADDDDGNLANGTPHACAIWDAFNRHGIKCGLETAAGNSCTSGCTPPAKPTLTATPGDNQVALSWTGSSGVYDVYRNEAGCLAGFTKIANDVAATSYTDTAVSNGYTYYYQVIAHPSGKETCASAPSDCQTVTLPIYRAAYVTGSATMGTPTGGDGDAYVDNCETASVTFTLANTGNTTLHNVRATITSSSGAVSIATTMPVNIGTLTAGATGTGSFTFSLGTGATKATCGETLNFSIVVTSDEQSPGSTSDAFTLGPAEQDTGLSSPTHNFETSTDGWTLTGFTRGNDRAANGSYSLHSSSTVNSACDKAVSPVFTATATSSMVMAVYYSIEVQSSSLWWDRANVHAVNVDTGVHTLLTPTGRTYNASGNAGAGLCHIDGQNGWGGSGTTWTPDATFNLASFNGQRIQIEVNYNTDTSVLGTGIWFDYVRFSNIMAAVCDAQTDSCGGCANPSGLTNNTAADLDPCADTGVRVTWSQDPTSWGDSGSGTRTYDVLRNGSPIASGLAYGTTSYTDTTGVNGTSYTYTVRYNNGCGSNATTSGVSAADNTTPAAPSAPGVSDVDACALSGVQITWGAVSGATAYDLYVDATTIVSGVTSPYTYSPGNSSSHTYQVRARNASCTGSWSTGTAGTDGNATPAAPGAPSVSDVSACALSGVQISWGAVSGATAYDLYVDSTTIVPNVSNPTTYSPGNSSSHTYMVRAKNATCTGAWSTGTAGTDANLMPGTPTAPTVTDLDNCSLTGVQITWGAVSGATAYDLYADTTTIVPGVTSPYTYSPGNTSSHTYQVRGRNASCTGAWSTGTAGTDATDCICTIPPTFAGLSSVAQLPSGSACGLRLTWSAGTSNCVNGPSLVYNVYRSTSSGFTPGSGNMITSCVTGTSYDDTTPVAGTTYYYIVRAEDSTSASSGPCNHGNQEANSVEVSGSVPLANETATQVTTLNVTTDPGVPSNLSPAFTITSPQAATLSYTSGYSSGGVSQELVIQPSNADTYVRQDRATTNYGTGTTMDARRRNNQARRALVSFDLSGIPAGATINSATLELYASAVPGTSQTLDAHRITASWGETTATWNNQPAYDATPAASIAGGTAVGWKTWTVTSLAQAWYASPSTNYGVLVKANLEGGTTTYTYTFATRENATTGDRPILRVNYTTAGGSGNWTDNAKVELIDPNSTATTLKAYGAADGSPYNVLAYYTGPGTYQVRLSENAGGTATMTGASMNVVGTVCRPGPAYNVQFLTARATNAQVKLEWLNPSGSYGSTRICWSTLAYPSNPTACGTVNVDYVDVTGTANTYDTTTRSAANGTKVYYTAFVDNGSGVYSSGKSVAATPFATPAELQWAYSTGASSLAPAGINPGALNAGSLYTLANDRVLHGMNTTASGGDWPRGGTFSWTPVAMNAPAQHRPGVLPLTAGLRIVLAAQDGKAYCVNAKDGSAVWPGGVSVGTMLQAGPAGLYSDFKPGAPNRTFVGTRNSSSANKLAALNPATGAEVYAFTNSSAQGGNDQAIGIITGVAVDYATYRVFFTSRAAAGGSSNTVWCITAGASSATLLWAVNKGDIDGAPLLYNGTLYVGNNSGVAYALNPATGAEVWSYSTTSDGPIKGYLYPHYGTSPLKLYFSTTTKIWGLQENGTATPTKLWEVTSVPGPSIPLVLTGTNQLLAGGNDGTLYQFDVTNPGATLKSRALGSGVIGSPGLDGTNNLAVMGSSAGIIYAVSVPLP